MSENVPPIVPSQELYYKNPPYGWTCFHCGETFKLPGLAKDHFGADPLAEAACLIKAGHERNLVAAIREAEEQLARYRDEEERGYEKGMRNGALAERERILKLLREPNDKLLLALLDAPFGDLTGPRYVVSGPTCNYVRAVLRALAAKLGVDNAKKRRREPLPRDAP
jgi:hypothetical protein